MLNSVQHPWRTINRPRAATVAPWILNQVQDGEWEKMQRLSTDTMPRSRSASREFVLEISALLPEPVDYPAGFLPRRYPDTPPVMLNSVQHPWRTINRSQAASVAPWSLSQVQDDEREERRGDRQAG